MTRARASPAGWFSAGAALLSASAAVVHAQTATSTSYAPQYTVPFDADNGAHLIANIVDPEAVDAQDVCPGYTASNVQETDYGFTADLALAGNACNVYGNDVDALTLTVEYQTQDRLYVGIQPSYIGSANESWFILNPDYVAKPSPESVTSSSFDLNFTWSNEPSFGFEITRVSTGDVLFSTMDKVLVFEDQFIEFVSDLPEDYNLYGLGETIHGLRLGTNFTKTMWNADVGDNVDANIYGTHPFYLETRYFESGVNGTQKRMTSRDTTNSSSTYTSASHGVYLRNAHGHEILLQEDGITWRTLGGSIDLYFFAGDTQPKVTSSYQKVIGLPVMQQYWTFGFHQCRWGYQNWSMTEDVVNNYKAFGIPLETIWNDIDYMESYRDFTNAPNRFSIEEGQAFLQRLHDNGQHYVPIVDSAIYVPNPANASDAYSTFDRGNASDAFILNPDGSLYIGDVWPGYTAFPDWFQASTGEWWTNEFLEYHKQIPYDGIWIDMSEVSSFCIGSCGTGNLQHNPAHPPFLLPGEPGDLELDYPESFNVTNSTEAAVAASMSASQSSANAATATSATTTMPYLRTTPTAGVREVDHPPYVINNFNGDLATHAIAPNATHNNGIEEYDVHNLWGHGILNATNNALAAVFPGKRPFIIGRSNFAGTGAFAGHWGGDNYSKWAYMFFSIPQALSFSLFGIPMFGVDTCGFSGNTDYELCSRWMQLSAFFPFYRNHNVLAAISQEAYVWSSVTEATKTAMNIRFNLLPYMYTLFYYAHTSGDTVMRALAWEFPNDPDLAAADRQFLLGPSILVTPVLEPQASTVDGVFPGLIEGTDNWYDWYTHESVAVPATKNTTIDAPLGHIPVFIRGGSVLAMQQPAMVTRDARKTDWSILVALGVDGTASGTLYLDDGESLTPNATLMVSFEANTTALVVGVEGTYVDSNGIANITVLGVGSGTTDGGCKLNGKDVKSGFDEQKGELVVSEVGVETAWGSGWTLTY